MNAQEILRLARRYGHARRAEAKVYDDMHLVDGLDEFDKRAVAWENRLHKAEKAKEKARGALLSAAFEWSQE